MIENEFLVFAREDFVRHFGNMGEVIVKEEFLNGETVIVVENDSRRAYYGISRTMNTVELIKVVKLKEHE